MLTENACTLTLAKPNPEYNEMGTRIVTSSKVVINAKSDLSTTKAHVVPLPSHNKKSLQKPEKAFCLHLEKKFKVLGDELEGDLNMKEGGHLTQTGGRVMAVLCLLHFETQNQVTKTVMIFCRRLPMASQKQFNKQKNKC